MDCSTASMFANKNPLDPEEHAAELVHDAARAPARDENRHAYRAQENRPDASYVNVERCPPGPSYDAGSERLPSLCVSRAAGLWRFALRLMVI